MYLRIFCGIDILLYIWYMGNYKVEGRIDFYMDKIIISSLVLIMVGVYTEVFWKYPIEFCFGLGVIFLIILAGVKKNWY